MSITLIFTLGNIDDILATPTFQPFIQVFYNATQSYAATNVMTAMIIILLAACSISFLATASRQIWSFARDKGLPGSSWLAQVTPGYDIPIHSLLISLLISSLLACINLGSSTALNAISSLGGVASLASYAITISCLIWRRLYGAPLPPRRWSLGKFGLPINILAFLFLIPVWFFTFWPLATPVFAETMNWSSAMFGGLVVLSMVYYVVWARHVYEGPVVLMKRE